VIHFKFAEHQVSAWVPKQASHNVISRMFSFQPIVF